MLLGTLLLALLFVVWLLAVWPPPVWYRTHWPKETAFMEMRREQREDAGRPERARRYAPVPAERIAPVLADAVVLAEDQRFRRHRGLDWREIRAAMGYRRAGFSWSSSGDRGELWRAVATLPARRDRVRGASTITQQLAKNLYLSPSRNPLRKVKEAVTAWRLESALGKDRILELYLNTVELGDEVWGAEAASRRYFRKPASALTRAEAAALAATLPFPLRSNPGYRPARMRARQQLILRRLGGERVEIPKLEAEAAPPPADSLPPAPVEIDTTPAVDSLVDTLRLQAPIETLPPAPGSAPDRMPDLPGEAPLPLPSDS